MKASIAIVGIQSALLLVTIPVDARSLSGRLQTEIDALFHVFDTEHSPGAAVVIVKDGEVVFQEEYGVANLEYGIPIESNTVFHIGSVSKQFTAFSILLLEARGQLSLDDSLELYLSELNGLGKTIKIRHLIHHTSGLREIEGLLQLCGISTADVIQDGHLLRLIRGQGELNFDPGEEIEYCNTGYILLAKIVEKITGESFSQWTKENLFEPLGMASSRFYEDCREIVKNRAYPYWMPEGGSELVKGILNYSYVGPTGVFTTSEDMAKWLMNFSHPTVGNQRIIERMLCETDTLNNGEVLDYGYGIGVTEHRGFRVNLHSGHDAGYRAADLYFPDYELGIAILSNYYSINPMAYGFKIADMLLEDEFPPQDITSEEETQDEEDVEPEAVREFSITDDQLREFQGNYISNELGVQYTLSAETNGLVARYWRNEDVVLSPKDKDHFSGDQWWFRDVRFNRDENDSVSGFRLTSGRVRNVLFLKSKE